MKKYFQLYDVASDYSLSSVPDKYQFGDLEHAKKHAQDLVDKWVAGMKKPVGKLSAYKIKWHRSSASGIRPESKMEWNGSIHDDELVYKIIERSKNPMVRKKKRSAKQLANDRRLGRMAKARAKAKRKKVPTRRRKTVRKKNVHATRRRSVRRKVSAKSHLWNVFKCYGKSVMFLAYSLGGKPAWTKDRGKAIVFKASGQAKRYASSIGNMRGYAKYNLGAVSQEQSKAQIAAHCAGKV